MHEIQCLLDLYQMCSVRLCVLVDTVLLLLMCVDVLIVYYIIDALILLVGTSLSLEYALPSGISMCYY